jgi:hypothetical protein
MFRCRLSTLLLLVVLAALGLAMVVEHRQVARRKAEYRDRHAAAIQWWENFSQEGSVIEKVSR